MDNPFFRSRKPFIFLVKIDFTKLWTTYVYSVDKFVEDLWNCGSYSQPPKKSKYINKHRECIIIQNKSFV